MRAACTVHKLCTLLVLAGVLLAAGVAGAEVPKLCLTVIVQEKIDGQGTDDSRAGAAILAGLDKLGICMVDAAGLPGLLEAVEGGKLAGRYGDVDWIVKAKVDSNKLGEGIMGTSFVRYEAALEAKVLTSDTGDLVGVLDVKGQGMDLQPRAAALMAAEQAGKRLVETFRDEASRMLRKPGRVRLSVDGLPDAQEVEGVGTALRQVPGVKGVQARGFAKGTAEFDLEVEGVTAAELAQRVHTQRGSGIAIDGYSLRRLHGQYDPAKRLRITLRIGPFENGTRQTEEEWLATAIPKLLQTQLTNTTSLDPLLTGPGQQPPTSVAEVLPYLEGGGEKETLLYLTGRYTYTGQQGELQVFVFDTGKPAQLFSLTEQGDVRKFMPVILAAARGVAEKSTSTVMQDAKLRGLACAAKLGGKPAGAQLAARKSSIEELQVALKLESKQLEGEVTLNPQTSRSLLRIWAPEVAETAVELSIEPGAAAQRVPFVLPLRSGEIAGPKPTSIELELSYRSKGEWRSEHVVRPVLLLPNEVASWMGSR